MSDFLGMRATATRANCAGKTPLVSTHCQLVAMKSSAGSNRSCTCLT